MNKMKLLVSSSLLLLLGIITGGCSSSNLNSSASMSVAEQEMLANVPNPQVITISIQKPDGSAPEEWKKCYGTWGGRWDGRMGGVIRIEGIGKDRMLFQYCWDGPEAGCSHVYGHLVAGDVPTMTATLLNGSKMKLIFNEQNGTMAGTFERAGTDMIFSILLKKLST